MPEKRLSYFFVILLLICFPAGSHAQLEFGLMWNPPVQQEAFNEELDIIVDSGISQLMIRGIISVHQMNRVHEDGFMVIANPGVRFPHKHFFESDADRFSENLNRYADFYGAYTSAEGAVMTHFGAYYSHKFRSQLKAITDSFLVSNPALTPVIITDRLHDYGEFESYRQIILIDDESAFLPDPAFTDVIYPFDFEPADIRRLQSGLINLKAFGEGIVLWMDGDAFLKAVMENPGVSELFNVYAESAEPVFPNPEPRAAEPPYNWFIVILLILLLVYLAFFRFMPTYNKALFRYFTNHPFFVVDIFERHLRFGRTSFFLLIILSLFGGLAVTVSMVHLFGGLPLATAGYHIPVLQTVPGIFLLASGVIFGINTISIIWISAACYRNEIFPQAASLQLWPQHIYIPLAVLAVAFYAADFYAGTSYFILLIILFILFVSFYLCSMDFMSNTTFKPILHFVLTFVLYTVVLIFVFGVFFFLTYQTAIWELVFYHLGDDTLISWFFGW